MLFFRAVARQSHTQANIAWKRRLAALAPSCFVCLVFFLVLLSFGDADPKTARQRATGPHTQGAKVQYDNAFPHFVWSSLSPLALEASARKLRTASRQPAKFNWRTRVPLRKGQPLIPLRTKLLKAACLVFGCLCFFFVCFNFPDTAFEFR